LTPSDAVVLEATANAWLFYDQLTPLVADVVVAHPQAVKLIAAARVKTDSRDTIKRASLLVPVWHVLTEQQDDTYAQAQAVARKLMTWITHHGVIPGQHRDRLLLLYQHRDELGLSEALEEIDDYWTTYRLSMR
jgi:hypothetical protein